MPTFRLETHDGQHDTIEGSRLDINDDRIVFVQRRDADWRAVASSEVLLALSSLPDKRYAGLRELWPELADLPVDA